MVKTSREARLYMKEIRDSMNNTPSSKDMFTDNQKYYKYLEEHKPSYNIFLKLVKIIDRLPEDKDELSKILIKLQSFLDPKTETYVNCQNSMAQFASSIVNLKFAYKNYILDNKKEG